MVLTLAAIVAIALPTVGSAQALDPVIQRAIAALDERTSYQIDLEMRAPYLGDEPVTVRRLVVTAPAFAYRSLVIVEGEVAVDRIATPEGEWRSVLGTPWSFTVPDARSWPLEADRAGPAFQRLMILSAQGLVLSEVGPELIGDQPVVRYRGEMPRASGSEGTVDVWAHAGEGWLVRSVVDLRLADGAVEPGPVPTLPAYEVTTVSRVDDPTIVVSAPDVHASPRPVAPGDPALAATVTRAFDALAELPSYVATVEDRTMGYASTVETTVFNGVETAAVATYTIGDTVALQVIARPGSTRSREGVDGEWGPADPEQVSCDGGLCDVEGLTRFDRALDGRAGTFTLLSDTESMDGVPVLHLRSEAGQWLPEVQDAPGTTDLWIAKDGGHVLRMDVDGQGARTSLVISHIGDPANEPFVTYGSPPPPAEG